MFKLYRNATVFGDLEAKNGGKLVLMRVQAPSVALRLSVASCNGERQWLAESDSRGKMEEAGDLMIAIAGRRFFRT